MRDARYTVPEMWSDNHERTAAAMRLRNENSPRPEPRGPVLASKAEPANALAVERHYTVKQVSGMWQLSTTTVTRIFRDEVGVLKIGSVVRGSRRYMTLRIPESVLWRVHARLAARK